MNKNATLLSLPSKIHNTQITFAGHAHTACDTYNLVSAYSQKRTCRHACKRWRNMQVAIDRNATCSWAQARTWRNYSLQPSHDVSRFAFSNIFVDHDTYKINKFYVKKIHHPHTCMITVSVSFLSLQLDQLWCKTFCILQTVDFWFMPTEMGVDCGHLHWLILAMLLLLPLMLGKWLILQCNEGDVFLHMVIMV